MGGNRDAVLEMRESNIVALLLIYSVANLLIH